jgi:hypothetical protein
MWIIVLFNILIFDRDDLGCKSRLTSIKQAQIQNTPKVPSRGQSMDCKPAVNKMTEQYLTIYNLKLIVYASWQYQLQAPSQ